MCLTLDIQKTIEELKRGKKEFVFYKVLINDRHDSSKYVTPVMWQEVENETLFSSRVTLIPYLALREIDSKASSYWNSRVLF
jgi:hypothetical protein